jgi:hypothetical protein
MFMTPLFAALLANQIRVAIGTLRFSGPAQRPMALSNNAMPWAVVDYLTLTNFRRTRGRGSPANTLPNLSTVPNSAPLPVVVAGLPP